MDITMSRVHLTSDTCHIYFMHTKVNHLLYTCPLVPFEDGILLDPSLVSIHRCERSYTFIGEESKMKRTSTPSKREAWKRRRKRQEKAAAPRRPRAHGHVPCPRDPRVHGTHGPRAHGLMRQVSGYPVRTGSTYPVHTGPPVRGCWAWPLYPHLVPTYHFIPWTYIYSPSSSI